MGHTGQANYRIELRTGKGDRQPGGRISNYNYDYDYNYNYNYNYNHKNTVPLFPALASFRPQGRTLF